MGTLFNNDATIYRKFFKEQAKLLGIHVKYQYPIDPEFSLHGTDDQLGFSEPIELDIILDQSPKLKTLKKFNWISEDASDKPFLAQVPYDTPNLQKNCRIILDVPEPLHNARIFKVTDITVDQILPDSWYCKLAPVFDVPKTIKPSDYKDKSYTFLKIDENAT